MPTIARVSISCPDRTGLIAAVAGRLFDLGADLGDTAFAVLGAGAEFTTVCALPDGVALGEVEAGLRALPELAGAQIMVQPFALDPLQGPSARVSHLVEVSGADRPGLIARLCEAFGEFGANIVRLNSERVPQGEGALYVARFAVSIPPASAGACLATVSNTAEALQLSCAIHAL